MKKITSYVLLAILLCSFIFIFIPQPVYADNWLEGFTYRKKIVINGSVDKAFDAYQLPLVVQYGAGTDEGATVYCDSDCVTNFSDIRFTELDGETLLYYWDETIYDSSNSTKWIEFTNVPKYPHTNEFYMYYGNTTAVSSLSNMTGTFIVSDDFEDAVAGIWTTAAGAPVYNSNAHDIGDLGGYTGTQALMLPGVAAAPQVYCDVANSNDIAIRYWIYKETAADILSVPAHGDNIRRERLLIDNAENIYYVDDSGNQDTGFNITPDDWELFELNELNYNGSTYDIYLNDVIIQNNADMQTNGTTDDELWFVGDVTPGDDLWVDNVIVRYWAESEPFFGEWSNLQTNIGVETRYVKGIGDDWGILDAYITGINTPTANVTQIGFDYGTSATMPESWTEASTRTECSHYDYIADALGYGSSYYFRAKVYNGTDWVYGDEKRFALSPMAWEYVNTGDDAYATYNTTTQNKLFQSFSVVDLSHTIEYVNLKLRRYGDPATMTVSIYEAGDGSPSGYAVASGILDTSIIDTVTPKFYTIYLDTPITLSYGETYAIVIETSATTANNYIQWRWDSDGGIDGGNAGYSTDDGVTWTQVLASDMLFEVFGESAIQINTAKVFSYYLSESTEDWLFVYSYLNEYEPYYNNEEITSSHFAFQLVDNDTAIAQVACNAWGYRPASIYINNAGIQSKEWGSEYRIRLYCIDDDNYQDYPLFAEDWYGSNLIGLDETCINIAKQMENYDSVIYTAYVGGRGTVLNEQGGVLFEEGIPGLSYIRPNLFQFAILSNAYIDETGEITYTPSWVTNLGPEITTVMNNWGNVFSVSGKTVAAILFITFAFSLGIFGVARGHAMFGGIVVVAWIPFGVWLGLILPVILGVAFALAALLLVYQIWWGRA